MDAENIQTLLLSRMRRWADEYGKHDRSLLEQVEHQDAVFTFPDGRRLSREEHVTRELDIVVSEMDITDFTYRQYGKTVVTWWKHTLIGEVDEAHFGKEFTDRARTGMQFAMTSVWVKFDDEWRVVSQDAHLL